MFKHVYCLNFFKEKIKKILNNYKNKSPCSTITDPEIITRGWALRDILFVGDRSGVQDLRMNFPGEGGMNLPKPH